MRYIAPPFIVYWPIWLAFRAVGLPYIGMAVAALAVVASWSLLWRMEFGYWRFWK